MRASCPLTHEPKSSRGFANPRRLCSSGPGLHAVRSASLLRLPFPPSSRRRRAQLRRPRRASAGPATAPSLRWPPAHHLRATSSAIRGRASLPLRLHHTADRPGRRATFSQPPRLLCRLPCLRTSSAERPLSRHLLSLRAPPAARCPRRTTSDPPLAWSRAPLPAPSSSSPADPPSPCATTAEACGAASGLVRRSRHLSASLPGVPQPPPLSDAAAGALELRLLIRNADAGFSSSQSRCRAAGVPASTSSPNAVVGSFDTDSSPNTAAAGSAASARPRLPRSVRAASSITSPVQPQETDISLLEKEISFPDTLRKCDEKKASLVEWLTEDNDDDDMHFYFEFYDVNKEAIAVSFELEFWIFTLDIKLSSSGHRLTRVVPILIDSQLA
ncbi:hypothetical protein U9M48_027164 [Paspalum notatum var. saurae]|uniref:Uncharacterized protein n=1 Tax=Paspalum notatum var. saurae TaxID=547442 RepID=A0AAQ3WZW2_PASNO